jgi:hypothetical protein
MKRGNPGEEDVMEGKTRKPAKRTESLIVRLTPEEVKMVKALAGRQGKTVSEWIREKIYKPPTEEAAELLRVAQLIAGIERPVQNWRLAETNCKPNHQGRQS